MRPGDVAPGHPPSGASVITASTSVENSDLQGDFDSSLYGRDAANVGTTKASTTAGSSRGLMAEWHVDPQTRKRVRWSSGKQAWVDKDGEVVTRTRNLDDRAAPSSSSGTRGSRGAASQPFDNPRRGSPRRGSTPTERNDEALSANFSGMALSPRSGPSNPWAQIGGSGTSEIPTLWDVTRLASIQDPFEDAQRDVNLKRISEVHGQAQRRQGYGVSQNPENDYKPGRVIEVLLVPPQAGGSSNTTRITPREPFGSTGLLRLRRFVIINQSPNGRDCFQALAIKTYNGLGVASPGVIKFHHAIIFTNRLYSSKEEEPKVRRDGRMDRMQPQAIRVMPYDKTQALDPMARLDYCDIYELDYGFANIRLFGKVHDDSRAALRTQYDNVWAALRGNASGMAGQGLPTHTSRAPSEPGEAETPLAGPSSRVSTRTAFQTSAGGPATPSVNWTLPNSGPIGDAEMRQLLRDHEAYAKRNNLGMPEEALTQHLIRGLAASSHLRSQYFASMRKSWREQQGVEEDEDEDGTDESEDDDDENQDSD